MGADPLHAAGAATDAALGLSLTSAQLGAAQMGLRAALVYAALLVLVRLGKKRFLGRATAFDVVLVITVGSIAGRAVTGGAPLVPALAALLVLIVVHWVFSLLGRDWPSFSGLIKGHSTVLVDDGRLDRRALRRAHMSKDDLAEALRSQGIVDIREVREARLERSGSVSVIKSKPE